MPKQAASEAKHRRNVTAAKWDAKNTRLFACKLNRNTDADLIAWVEAQPNTQAYFKALIRADIEKNQEDRPAGRAD